MKLSQEALNKIRVASKLGRDRDIQSAVDLALGEINAKRHWQEELGKWIADSDGYFYIRTCYKELGALNTNDEGAIRVAINFYKNDGLIEPDPWVHGRYRRIIKEHRIMHWDKSSPKPYDVILPFGLGEFASLYSKNIAIIAGNKGSGKTTTLLKFALDNADKHKIHYAVSDMGEEELGVRIELFVKEYGNKAHETFKRVTFFEQIRNHADTIEPNDVNVIDYLEVVENFHEVGRFILNIWDKLDKGIAVIAIQKSKHKDYGRGGDFSLEKARLYLSLTHSSSDPIGNTCKIISVKNRRTSLDPHGFIQKFRIIEGTKIETIGTWYCAEDEEDAMQASGKSWWEK